jgi:GT2 family glycosyltransferase
VASISVVLVNFNGMKWLDACLTSVLSQDFPDGGSLEVIVIDNGSSDESANFVRNRFPDVRFYEMGSNLGFAAGCEFGVTHSTSEFILFLNNDTIVPVRTICNLHAEIVKRELDVIAAREAHYTGGASALARTTIDFLGFPAHFSTGEKLGDGKSFFLSAVCLLVRKSTYLESGGFDVSFFMYFEDIDWFWRLLLLGYQFDYSLNCTIQHAGHGSTGGHGANYQRFLWRNVNLPRMLLKNYSTASLLWVLPLYATSCLLEVTALLLIGRRELASSYVKALKPFFKSLDVTFKERKEIQRSRTVSDRVVFARMYPYSSKFRWGWSRLRPRLSKWP